jgi:hypothetical protein
MSHRDDDQLKSLSSHAVVVAEVETTSYSKDDDDDCDVVETEPKDIVAEVKTANNNKDDKVAKILPSSTDDGGHEITSKYNRDDDEAKLPKSSIEEDVVVTETETTNDTVAKLPSYTDYGDDDTATGPVKPKKAPKKFKKGKNTTSRIPPPSFFFSASDVD